MRTSIAYLLLLTLLTTTQAAVTHGPDPANSPNSLREGESAPRFEAPGHNGQLWKSEDHVGRKYVVVFFYPAAFTSGCTRQACLFRDHLSQLQQAGVEVVGISGDRSDGLRLFQKHHSINFPLLSDENGQIAKAFGVPVRDGDTIIRSIDGVEHSLVRGVTASRWTFVIAPNGRVIAKNTAVDPEKDATNVLEIIRRSAASTQ
ncbi:MAG: peroxiredoxin [Planctomycetota bacterium]